MKKEITGELKEFIPSIALFLVVCLGIFLFLVPKIKQIITLRNTLSGQDEEIKKLSIKYVDLSSLSEPELYDTFSLLLTALPDEKDFYLILQNIKSIFKDSNTSLINFEISPGIVSTDSAKKTTKTGADASDMSLKVSFVSSLDSIKGIISKIENSLPLMEISSLKLLPETKSATQSSALQNFLGELSLKTFYVGLPKTVGTVSKPLPKISTSDKKIIENLRSFEKFNLEVSTQPVIIGKENPFPF